MTDFGRRAGVGDMKKSVYDPGDDGLVDDAEKLEGSSKAQVQDHAPQTHGHIMSYITGLITALAGKSATGHAHAKADVTNLVTNLAGKSPTGHTHTEVEVTDLDHDALKIKGVDVDDTDKGEGKVLAYNATSGNLEYETAAAGERYVDRGNIDDWDWHKADLTEDWNWRDLGAASIVPDGASAILLRVQAKEDTTGRIIEIKQKGNANNINAAVLTINVGNIQKDMCCIVACDATGEVEYRCSSTVWTQISICVRGWFI